MFKTWKPNFKYTAHKHYISAGDVYQNNMKLTQVMKLDRLYKQRSQHAVYLQRNKMSQRQETFLYNDWK